MEESTMFLDHWFHNPGYPFFPKFIGKLVEVSFMTKNQSRFCLFNYFNSDRYGAILVSRSSKQAS